jgi:hypothetical protein
VGYSKAKYTTETAGFHHDTLEAFTLHGHYAPHIGSYLLIIWEILLASHSGVNQPNSGGKQINPLLQKRCCGHGLFWRR